MGYAMTTRWGGADASKLQMIGFDMGGTSTGERHACWLRCAVQGRWPAPLDRQVGV